METGVDAPEVLTIWSDFFSHVLLPLMFLVWAGSNFGVCAGAEAIRERAGCVLLDVGRPRSSNWGTASGVAALLFLFVFNLVVFLIFHDVVPHFLWAVAAGLVLTSHVALIWVGFLRGRLEVATNGLLMNGRDLLRWGQIRSWKWRAGPSPVLMVYTGAIRSGMVRQFQIPEPLEPQVNRLLLEYRGNGPYPPESQSATNGARSA